MVALIRIKEQVNRKVRLFDVVINFSAINVLLALETTQKGIVLKERIRELAKANQDIVSLNFDQNQQQHRLEG